jgi:hypothetical protein
MRGTVQEQAIIELQALEPNHPYRQATLELIFNLHENLKINQCLHSTEYAIA